MVECSLGVYVEGGCVMLDLCDEVLVLTPEQALAIAKGLSTAAEQAKIIKESLWTKKH